MVEPLAPGDVHVWYRTIDERQEIDETDAAASLSPDERERAARFMFARDRVVFVAAHDLVRQALSRYADVPPAAWVFVTEEHGKPELGAPHDGLGLRFNLSHTRGLVACVVSRDCDVGVDVEALDTRADIGALATRFFAPNEAAAIDSCPEADRLSRFIELWTLKESYVKAIGHGLSHPLDTFSFVLDGVDALRFNAPVTEASHLWRFGLATPTHRHRLAVAARRTTATPVTISIRGQLPASGPPCILARISP